MGQILVSDEAGAPSSPAAGNRNLFATAANGLQVKDAAGNLYQLTLVSSGSAGKVPRMTANNIIAPGSLADDGTNISLAGGLNIGTASGAVAGEILASAGLSLSSDTARLKMHYIPSIATNTQTQLLDAVGSQMGIAFIGVSGGYWGIYNLRGSAHVATEYLDPDAIFSPTKGTANVSNIFWETDRWYVENKVGNNRSYHVLFFGMNGNIV